MTLTRRRTRRPSRAADALALASAAGASATACGSDVLVGEPAYMFDNPVWTAGIDDDAAAGDDVIGRVEDEVGVQYVVRSGLREVVS